MYSQFTCFLVFSVINRSLKICCQLYVNYQTANISILVYKIACIITHFPVIIIIFKLNIMIHINHHHKKINPLNYKIINYIEFTNHSPVYISKQEIENLFIFLTHIIIIIIMHYLFINKYRTYL